MVAAWRRVAYTYADLEDEVEICIMSLCGAVVKSEYPWSRLMERWLAEEQEVCYVFDVPQVSGYNSMSIIMLDATIGLVL